MVARSVNKAMPDFQYELIRTAPAEALAVCLKLRAEGHGKFTPVIVDSPDKYALNPDEFANLRGELPEILSAARELSVQDFFTERRTADLGLYAELEEGEWPAVPHTFEPYLPQHLSEVFIAKVPAPNSFEALAYIGFGGWNECPTDEEHVGVLRYWHERYGADLVAIGGDMIECTVERPPITQDEALVLASAPSFSCRRATLPR
jgi:hypothetical protein